MKTGKERTVWVAAALAKDCQSCHHTARLDCSAERVHKTQQYTAVHRCKIGRFRILGHPAGLQCVPGV